MRHIKNTPSSQRGSITITLAILGILILLGFAAANTFLKKEPDDKIDTSVNNKLPAIPGNIKTPGRNSRPKNVNSNNPQLPATDFDLDTNELPDISTEDMNNIAPAMPPPGGSGGADAPVIPPGGSGGADAPAPPAGGGAAGGAVAPPPAP